MLAHVLRLHACKKVQGDTSPLAVMVQSAVAHHSGNLRSWVGATAITVAPGYTQTPLERLESRHPRGAVGGRWSYLAHLLGRYAQRHRGLPAARWHEGQDAEVLGA